MSQVAILHTRPDRVLEDYQRLMHLADYADEIDPSVPTALKINVSWDRWFPACSTTPWQLEGVLRALLADGIGQDRIYACHNRTVVVSARKGERTNAHLPVVRRYGIDNVHLYESDTEWMHIRDAVGDLVDDFLALDRVYPDGFWIPRRFQGSNIIQMPTMKTHVFTTITGAMKNAFGGLLNENRHWCHEHIHEVLVDLLMIQQEIHSGLFAVMDGTFAGDGPGPRCMRPAVKNVILASSDQVAIDAIAARMMGFDPLEDIQFIRLAHERGLGCGDPEKIHIVGDQEAADENWGFRGPYADMTFAARMQHRIYWGDLKKPLGWTLYTPLAVWSYVASILYHDWFWYPMIGKPRVRDALKTPWGRLFRRYRADMVVEDEDDG